jgi:hypothetical protein
MGTRYKAVIGQSQYLPTSCYLTVFPQWGQVQPPFTYMYSMLNGGRELELIFLELGIRYFFPFSLFASPLLQHLFSLSLLRYFS